MSGAGLPRVALGEVVRRVCWSAHKDLEALSTRLANVDDAMRKAYLQGFLRNVRHRLIKLLALVRWCVSSGALVNGALSLAQEYAVNEVRIFDCVGLMRCRRSFRSCASPTARSSAPSRTSSR